MPKRADASIIDIAQMHPASTIDLRLTVWSPALKMGFTPGVLKFNPELPMDVPNEVFLEQAEEQCPSNSHPPHSLFAFWHGV